jgi:hypothetical protein
MDEGSKKGGNPHIDPNIILDPMKVDLVSIRTSYSHQIEPDDIQSADDIEDLLSEMHDFAEHEFRYYWLKESEFNSFISAAEQRGAIVSSEWEFCHYRHPSFPGPNYIRIIERENGCQRHLKNASARRSKSTSVMLARRPPNWGPFRQASRLGGIIRRRVRAGPA